MDSQIVIVTGQWKVKVILGVGGLATIVILAFIYRIEVGLILLAVGGVVATRLGFWAKHQHELGKLQERQLAAQTRAIELDTAMTYWRVRQEQYAAYKLKLESHFIQQKAGTFIVGDIPFQFYPTATASAGLATVPALALPSGNLDYFSAMSDPLQAYAIVGPQRIGKSILAQHLAQYLARRGETCIIIGTKAKAGEWLDCKRFIGNEAVPGALASMLAETIGRLAANRTTPQLCVFLDDWLNTVALDDGLAEQFFLEAATRMLTAGIVPYFLLQSDSKADWGTKHGAQLKNNFVHLILTAPRESGRIIHNRLKGVMIYPGDKAQYEVGLPVGLPTFGDGEPDIELAQWPLRATSSVTQSNPETEKDAEFARLVNEGSTKSAACWQVYGKSFSGPFSQRLNRLLSSSDDTSL